MNWIIGDVHGMADELKLLVSRINRRDKNAEYWFVGDFCDRGFQSKQTIDFILSLGEKAHCTRGNHDDIFNVILTGEPSDHSELYDPKSARMDALQWFLPYGMLDTLASYGIDKGSIIANRSSYYGIATLLDKVPDSHKDFYKNLPILLDGPDFFLVHASYPIDKEFSTSYKDTNACVWNRFEASEISAEKVWNKMGYFGHTPTSHYGFTGQIVTGPKITLVDTGGVFGDTLTAVCHETRDIIYIDCTKSER